MVPGGLCGTIEKLCMEGALIFDNEQVVHTSFCSKTSNSASTILGHFDSAAIIRGVGVACIELRLFSTKKPISVSTKEMIQMSFSEPV